MKKQSKKLLIEQKSQKKITQFFQNHILKHVKKYNVEQFNVVYPINDTHSAVLSYNIVNNMDDALAGIHIFDENTGAIH